MIAFGTKQKVAVAIVVLGLYAALAFLCLYQYPPLMRMDALLIGPASLMAWGPNSWPAFMAFTVPLVILFLYTLFRSEGRCAAIPVAMLIWVAGGWFAAALGI